ncbi:Docking protein 2 [Merluccius polli]|uniref:Docking protein 2 n=1 Tax=Merluccius polli TaxID=89951 RepID=A0AA47MAX2_MERPO|nr:Docking protein 2 [Merluccius polli]
MEDAIRMQGLVYIQQQRFGKRWKRVWCILFGTSSRSIARLEYFDCKESGSAALDRSDKALKKQQESKKVIRLSDCIRVTAMQVDGCPRDTDSFLVETTDKLYIFAVDSHHLDDWTHTLCETAFPTKRHIFQKKGRNDEEGMEDNSLYSSRETLHDFRVCVRWTEAAERCGLDGVCVLRLDAECLYLLDPNTHQPLFSWPYCFLRRFGRDKTSFSFEAGRRCDSGEGSFEFDTRQGNAVFQAIDSAIRAHRKVLPHRNSAEADVISPETYSSPHTPPQPDQAPRSCVLHMSYSNVTFLQGEHCVYSKVDDFAQTRDKAEHKKKTLPLSYLAPPADNFLTGVKSLTLETREVPIPRKNQVKSILSCPLLSSNADLIPTPNLSPNLSSSLSTYHTASSNPTLNPNPEHMYAQVSKAAAPPGATGTVRNTGKPREKRRDGGGSGSSCPPALVLPEPAYSLPFDHITNRAGAEEVMADPQELLGLTEPLYDSIDESKIKHAMQAMAKSPRGAYSKAENIYDQPEGYGATGLMLPPPPPPPASMYDDLEEIRGDAWRTMGIEPTVHEVPFDSERNDYAIPKHCRMLIVHQDTGGEGAAGEGGPYENVIDAAERESS